MDTPHIELLTTEGCPHAEATGRLTAAVATDLIPGSRIARVHVRDAAHAVELGFVGSPTVRVAGSDLEVVTGRPPGLT